MVSPHIETLGGAVMPRALPPAPMIRPASPGARRPGLLAIHPACSCVSSDAARCRLPPLHIVLARGHQPPRVLYG